MFNKSGVIKMETATSQITIAEIIVQLRELVENQRAEIRELKEAGEKGKMYEVALEDIKNSLIEIVVGNDQ